MMVQHLIRRGAAKRDIRIIPVGICNQVTVGAMDGGRYAPRQAEWDNSSASESYDAIHNSELRSGAAYPGVGYLEGRFERGSVYPRDSFPKEILYEREIFGTAPAVLGLWQPAKRRSIEDELSLLREVQRHEKVGFVDTLPDSFDRVPRCSRDRDSYDGDEYEYIRRPFQGSREGRGDAEFDFPSRYRGCDSNRERSRRERDWRQRKERDWNRSRSRDRDRDWSPHDMDCFRDRNRSRSVSYDERSRRPRSYRSRTHGWREESIADVLRQDTAQRERPRDRNGRSNNHERATLVKTVSNLYLPHQNKLYISKKYSDDDSLMVYG